MCLYMCQMELREYDWCRTWVIEVCLVATDDVSWVGHGDWELDMVGLRNWIGGRLR